MKLRLKKVKFNPQYLFYIGFFVAYALIQYYFLYHLNGLQPFQVNYHFTSNFIGSFSKRFLSETSVYGLIFYLLYYSKEVWKKIILIAFFEVFLFINLLSIGFYSITRSNFQFYILEGFNWHVFFSFFNTKITLVSIVALMSIIYSTYLLYKINNKKKGVWLFKKWTFISLLLALAISAPYLPMRYDDHKTLFAGDSRSKNTFKTVELENAGHVVFFREIKHYLHPKKVSFQELGEEESESLEKYRFDNKITQEISNPPNKIVLVIAESLNRDFLSYYNKEAENLTPNIDGLLNEYPHIDNFYPSGPYTLQGVSAIMCGHTNGRQTQNNQKHICAPKLMSDNGYENEFIRGASKYYVGENLHFKKFGFDNIFAKEDFEIKYPDFIEDRKAMHKTWGYSDKHIFNEAVSRLKESDSEEKQFLTLLTVDTHIPGGRCYYEKTDDDPDNPLEFSIKCFDRVFGEFIEDLKSEGLLDENLLVILTSDQLYPSVKGIAGSDFATSFILKPARIPFLVITESDIDIKSAQGSQIDIAATLLDLVNINAPDYYMGKSLISNESTFSMGQDRSNGYLIIGSKFYPLSLNPRPFKKASDGPKSFVLDLPSNATTKDFEDMVQQKVDELDQEQDRESALFKWYYNKFYNLSR